MPVTSRHLSETPRPETDNLNQANDIYRDFLQKSSRTSHFLPEKPTTAPSWLDLVQQHCKINRLRGAIKEVQEPTTGLNILQGSLVIASSVLQLYIHFRFHALERGKQSSYISILPQHQFEASSDIPLITEHEFIFIAQISLIATHWVSTVSLFCNGRWRQKYYPWAFTTVVAGTVMASRWISDIATILIVTVPCIVALCIIGCGLVEACQWFWNEPVASLEQ